MKRFNTIAKWTVTPVLVIALTAGSVMAQTSHHIDAADHHASAMSGHIVSHPGVKQVATFGHAGESQDATQSLGASTSSDQSELGATSVEPFNSNTFSWSEQYAILP
ncbi:hypothetical protein K4L04_00870 [Phaeobacter inhibens]|uniref:hypothetical protein n=1 Tax=Phaeobacter inhibens TaxID=221822 RepID=UPI0021A33BED|nr:hypothetical protein [Phaeobacter inhibens]UWR76547.1 hypothetical protein K4L04_00870 [Phaeobacter inhibens]